MNSKNRQIEASLRRAVGDLTPDVFEKLNLQTVPQKKGTVITMKNNINIKKIIAAAAAVCIILAAGTGGTFYYDSNIKTDSVIGIDVNPSVEILTNKHNRVVSVEASNDDGAAIIDGMDLKKTDIKTAVNAIIGSMVQNGYLSGTDANILVSISNDNSEKAHSLRGEVLADIDDSLTAHSLTASVLNQTVPTAEESVTDAESFADANSVSMGKAIFILNLAKKDSSIDPVAFAKMSIREIAKYISQNKIDISDIVDYDLDDSIWENIADSVEDIDEDIAENEYIAESSKHIGTDAAKKAALDHAKISADAATMLRAVFDSDDGRAVYEIDFVSDGIEYEYEIDALSGKVNEYDSEPYDGDDDHFFGSGDKDGDGNQNRYSGGESEPTTASSSVQASGSITAARAKEIAVAHAGFKISNVSFLKVELDNDDGKKVYEVEFRKNGREYDYEISASDGSILKHESERDSLFD